MKNRTKKEWKLKIPMENFTYVNAFCDDENLDYSYDDNAFYFEYKSHYDLARKHAKSLED